MVNPSQSQRGPRAHSVRGWIATLFLCALSAGCRSTYERRDWSGYEGPGAQYFQIEEITFPYIEDPLEPMNRVSAGIDVAFLRCVLAPTAFMYRCVVPPPVRTHLSKAGDNLFFPLRFLNNLLQAKWRGAAEELSRFAVNTSVGVLGLFDPAKDIGLEPHPEDFGQTLAQWGWKQSTYLVIPLIGPSTIRDGLGEIVDGFALPGQVFIPVTLADQLNKQSDEVDDTLRQIDSRYDTYEPARTLYVLNRENDVTNFSWARDESSATQTLDTVFLTFEDAEFPGKGHTESVDIASTGGKLPYTVWLQPDPAPLVYIVGGFAGHRMGNATLGLAEIAYRDGNSVVTVSNPSNWEFIEDAATVPVPGYAPVDAHDLHVALSAIDRDLERSHPGRFSSKRLSGISLGALQTLYIAATEDAPESEGLVAFDVYIAMDVPVALEHAMLQLDKFYNAPMTFPADERARRIDEILGKVLFLAQGELTPSIELPFTRLESEFLIGLAFRMDLQFILLQTQERHDMGVLRTKRSLLRRAPAFREASEYSFMEYMHAFVLPYYATRDPEITFDEAGAKLMFERCDLHAIADGLKRNDRIRVFANENDFLLRPEDVAWLREILGDRAHFFPAGGHLGNLHRKTIQEVIHGIVEQAADEAGDEASNP